MCCLNMSVAPLLDRPHPRLPTAIGLKVITKEPVFYYSKGLYKKQRQGNNFKNGLGRLGYRVHLVKERTRRPAGLSLEPLCLLRSAKGS